MLCRLLFGVIVLAAAGCTSVGAQVTGKSPELIEATSVPQTREQITLSFSPVVRKAAPAVVNIYTRKIVERRASPFAGDPFFERFFREMFPGAKRGSQRIENSLGSGVIVDPSGIVVSNHHVIAGADEITVVLQDRREYDGEVIFADEASDLAVMQLDDAGGLPVLELRDSNTLEVGDLVLAIGNPFGVGQTVTSGIISGLARSGGRQSAGLFIQTDAAINPGNSGGALVDMGGRLVGVNTAILSRSGGSNGIGFAVPADLVARVINSAREGLSELQRPWLGIETQTVDGDLAAALGLAVPEGVLIEALHPDSPIALAGLKRGDVIVALGDDPVNSQQELDFRAATRGIGEQVGVSYLNNGSEREARIALMEAPERPTRDATTLGRTDGLPGLSIVNINPRVIEETGLPIASTGVLVTRTQGPARRVGLRPGDILREVDGQKIEDVATLTAILGATSGDVLIDVERKGRRGQVRYRR